MTEKEVIRIAVRASMAAMGAVLAGILALYLLAAAVSPQINIPGVRVPHHVISNGESGD